MAFPKVTFDLAVRGLLGEDAPVSASTVARLKSKWNDELAQWRSRPLDDLEVVYMWVDGVYVKAGLEKEKAAVLVVMAALSDGSKVVVSTVPGYRESTESWSEVLRDIPFCRYLGRFRVFGTTRAMQWERRQRPQPASLSLFEWAVGPEEVREEELVGTRR